jgi:hypothetical protein
MIEDQAMSYPGSPVVGYYVETFESESVPLRIRFEMM